MSGAYGQPESRAGTTDTPFTFVAKPGYYNDPELDLYFARARYYDSATGQWLSQDPIAADVNPYRYVGNDPVNATDPSGLQEAYARFYDKVARWWRELLGETAPKPSPRPQRAGLRPVEPSRPYSAGALLPPAVAPPGPCVNPALRPSVPKTLPPEWCPKWRPPASTPTQPAPQCQWAGKLIRGLGPIIIILADPTEMGDAGYKPEERPIGIDIEIEADTCQRRWGFQPCPAPARTARTVAMDFLRSQNVDTPTRRFLISRCNPLSTPIPPGPKSICRDGGVVVHCGIMYVDALSGLGHVPFRTGVSLFCCNCCHHYRRGRYCKGTDTPAGLGRPHWSSASQVPQDLYA